MSMTYASLILISRDGKIATTLTYPGVGLPGCPLVGGDVIRPHVVLRRRLLLDLALSIPEKDWGRTKTIGKINTMPTVGGGRTTTIIQCELPTMADELPIPEPHGMPRRGSWMTFGELEAMPFMGIHVDAMAALHFLFTEVGKRVAAPPLETVTA